MATSRRPTFEASFGSRRTNEPLQPRRRDRHLHEEHEDPMAGSSASELFDTVNDNTTVGDRVEPAEPDPSIPIEVVEAQPRGRDRADLTPDGGQVRVGTRWFRIRRRLVTALGVLIVSGIVYYLASLFQVWSTGRTDSNEAVDAIVVLGAAQYDGRPSPQLAARLDHVVELWPQDRARLVVVTGGNIPGDRFTEAEASAAYLVDRGIPDSAILLENEGSNTYESLESVERILGERGLDEVLIVTDPYHAMRSRLIADEVGLDPHVSSTDTSVVGGGESLRRHLQEAAGVAVGRIIGFERLTDLVD